MYDIIINDRSMNSIGLFAITRLSIPKAKEKIITANVLSLDGTLYRSTGKYEDVETSVNFNIFCEPSLHGDYTREYYEVLKRAKKIQASDDPYYFRKIKHVEVDYNRLADHVITITAHFTLDPWEYIISGAHLYSNLKEVEYNVYDTCEPEIHIIGSGTGILSINGYNVSFYSDGYLIIDVHARKVYDENRNDKSISISGDFEKMVLAPGANTIKANGFRLKIRPNWRRL